MTCAHALMNLNNDLIFSLLLVLLASPALQNVCRALMRGAGGDASEQDGIQQARRDAVLCLCVWEPLCAVCLGVICIGYKNIPVNLGGAPKAIQISGT